MIFSDPRTEDGEERVRRAVLTGWRASTDVIECAVGIEIVCFFARPARLKRKADRGTGPMPYTGKPDADNISKLILDGITRSGAWRDDTQVADLVVVRRYLPLSDDGTEIGVPRMEVRVWAL